MNDHGTRRTGTTGRTLAAAISAAALLVFLLQSGASAKTEIRTTKHNLSLSGTGDYRSDVESRICVFCHTPHNATPSTPLWNKALNAVNYDPYASSTLRLPGRSAPPPSGPTRLCLTCHDGTIALGAVVNPAEGLPLAGRISAGPSYIGTDLTDDHPVSFSYYASQSQAPQEFAAPPQELPLYGYDANLHCSTCHDPHNDDNGKFLQVSSKGSNLCAKCHVIAGWQLSPHRSSAAQLPTPLPGMEWTRTLPSPWLTVGDYGCEGCHRPHGAGGKSRLMRSGDEEANCYACHDGSVAANNIRAQFAKSYTHPVAATAGLHDPGESPSQLSGHVECADCHNAHAANSSPAIPPAVTGRLAAVPGVQSDGITPVAAARYEYEICFKCHAGSAPQLFLSGYAPIQRVVNTFDTSVEFNTANPSYMPVVDRGKNPDVPSLKLPGADADTPPYLGITAKIYCSDCHSDDGATRGPHGSQYAPLLRRRYETAVGTQESDQNYGLCYRCHDRFSILSDATFRKTIAGGTGGHSGHLQAAAGRAIPCSVCHDPHGVKDLPGAGSHTHLINFNAIVVKPAGGNPFPLFTDTGSRSGTCTLICHFPDSTTKEHMNAAYP